MVSRRGVAWRARVRRQRMFALRMRGADMPRCVAERRRENITECLRDYAAARRLCFDTLSPPPRDAATADAQHARRLLTRRLLPTRATLPIWRHSFDIFMILLCQPAKDALLSPPPPIFCAAVGAICRHFLSDFARRACRAAITPAASAPMRVPLDDYACAMMAMP